MKASSTDLRRNPARAGAARTSSRRIGRRARRGAATLEGLLVATTLIALFALALVVHHRQVQRLTSSRDTLLAAWTLALDGCQRSTDYRAALEDVLGSASAPRPERLVIASPLPSTTDANGTAIAPCNERPRAHDADFSTFSSGLEHKLLPSTP